MIAVTFEYYHGARKRESQQEERTVGNNISSQRVGSNFVTKRYFESRRPASSNFFSRFNIIFWNVGLFNPGFLNSSFTTSSMVFASSLSVSANGSMFIDDTNAWTSRSLMDFFISFKVGGCVLQLSRFIVAVRVLRYSSSRASLLRVSSISSKTLVLNK